MIYFDTIEPNNDLNNMVIQEIEACLHNYYLIEFGKRVQNGWGEFPYLWYWNPERDPLIKKEYTVNVKNKHTQHIIGWDYLGRFKYIITDLNSGENIIYDVIEGIEKSNIDGFNVSNEWAINIERKDNYHVLCQPGMFVNQNYMGVDIMVGFEYVKTDNGNKTWNTVKEQEGYYNYGWNVDMYGNMEG